MEEICVALRQYARDNKKTKMCANFTQNNNAKSEEM